MPCGQIESGGYGQPYGQEIEAYTRDAQRRPLELRTRGIRILPDADDHGQDPKARNDFDKTIDAKSEECQRALNV